jgi:hypothetical protein
MSRDLGSGVINYDVGCSSYFGLTVLDPLGPIKMPALFTSPFSRVQGLGFRV